MSKRISKRKYIPTKVYIQDNYAIAVLEDNRVFKDKDKGCIFTHQMTFIMENGKETK